MASTILFFIAKGLFNLLISLKVFFLFISKDLHPELKAAKQSLGSSPI